MDWDLQPQRRYSSQKTGAYHAIPTLLGYEDIKKIKPRELVYDEKATLNKYEAEGDLFGDILDVKLTGIRRVSVHLMNYYSAVRGLDQMYMDLYDDPGLVHEVLSIYEKGYYEMFKSLKMQNLFSQNNDETYNSTGGLGYTDEIPQKGYNADCICEKDMWACAESQEFSLVSPEMHAEFPLPYEKRLMECFALSGYGCCEPLHNKLDYILDIKNVRRISISPWADIRTSAEKLKESYIFSWKPNPSHLFGDFNPEWIKNHIKDNILICKENGCQLEIILKDTHTCENCPERFESWIAAVRQAINEVY